MRKLRQHGIIVTALHNHWLFDQPRLLYMHFESLDQPIFFARTVRDAMNVLITGRGYVGSSLANGKFDMLSPVHIGTHPYYFHGSGLCDQFSQILGGTTHTFQNENCVVMKSRTNIKATVLDRQTQ